MRIYLRRNPGLLLLLLAPLPRRPPLVAGRSVGPKFGLHYQKPIRTSKLASASSFAKAPLDSPYPTRREERDETKRNVPWEGTGSVESARALTWTGLDCSAPAATLMEYCG
ncbi:uncharacterized protein LY89DRAFT_681905 [Mollisia scopiformis]|uniref:Uncharacterized protein n=1 Tax=Mollisia scopiformis TaxID=149040 RepID=A0A194XNT8_MOLSC|nr:uncharacterized protein LY89DRAFT_681905 [Mollisia scopiformis]KUJ21397.1 hypothetical protein LY89DRAFT_681905 [Mollisia scopiformis]